MKLRGPVENASLLILSIAFSFVLLEFLVRVFFPIYDPSGYVKFAQLPDGMRTLIGPRRAILRQVKNTGDYDVEVQFNDWGFRDQKLLTTATKEALFVVGDSFAFGWGVNARDRFSDRLQTTLNRPVYNIASGGSDLQGYHSLVHYAETSGIAIKNLIISVTMENDLHSYDNSGSQNPNLLADEAPWSLNLPALKMRLTEQSALYRLVTTAAHQTTWLRGIAVRLGLIIPNLEGIGDENISSEDLASSAVRVIQLSTDRNVVVLIIPSRRLWVGEAPRRAEASRVHAAFVDLLKRAGMNVVDMRPRLEADGNPLSNHFANDGHWNKVGHRLAADALTEAILLRRSWRPGSGWNSTQTTGRQTAIATAFDEAPYK